MELQILKISSRFAVLEWKNESCYYTQQQYEIYVNGEWRGKGQTNVFGIYDLLPDTAYKAVLRYGREERTLEFCTQREAACLNVLSFGAKPEGEESSAEAINAAVACCPQGGTVYFPPGIYKTNTVFLKSGVRLYLEKGAVIKSLASRRELAVLPGDMRPQAEGVGRAADEAKRERVNFGTWEGNPVDCFAAVITGIGVKDAEIAGEGEIDGGGRDGDWWEDPVTKRGAWRPRTIFLNGCEDICIAGVTIGNSPSWTVHPYYCKKLAFYDVTIRNPAVSPNTDGLDPESCQDVVIAGARISVGDDCIAIKSGRKGMAKRWLCPSERIEIRNCRMERGHGGVVIGSEIACGVKEVLIKQCLMRETDRGLRIKTQRGRGNASVVSGIFFENVIMEEVKTAFSINMYYYWGPDGHSEYVQSRKALPVDERTPRVGDLHMRNVQCRGCQAAGVYFLGLPEQPVELVEMEGVSIEFAESCRPDEPVMADGVGPVSGLGIYAENVRSLKLSDVCVSGYKGEPVQLHGVWEVKGDYFGKEQP